MLLTDLDNDLPPLSLDYDGIHQVVLNLLTNAVDAVPKQGGLVNVRTAYDAAAKQVMLSVADNGPGVREDQRALIFEPFQSTKGHGGTGLGLAVARKTVEELGGTIALNSPPEGGAVFEVRLPTVPGQPASPGDMHGPAT